METNAQLQTEKKAESKVTSYHEGEERLMWHRDRGLSRGGNTGAESQRDRSYLGKQMTEVGRSQRALIHGQERARAKARRQDGA